MYDLIIAIHVYDGHIFRIDNGSSDSRISVAHTLDREDEFDRTPKRRQSHEIEKFQPGLVSNILANCMTSS